MGSVAARARSRRGTRSAGPVERIASRQRGGVSVAPPDNVIDITDRSAFPSTQDTSGRSSIVPVRRETEPSRFIPEIATEPAEPRQTVEPLPAMARPTAALESSVDAPASAEPMPIEVPKIELAAVPVAVEPLMPEPPEGLSEGDQQRLAQVDHRAGRAADSQETLPSAAESATAARGAVTEPAAETEARAQGGLVEALNERPQPSPEIEALCERIMEAIAARRPPNEDSLLESSPVEEAQAVGQQLETSIESNSENVESSYDRLNETPTAEPRQLGQTLESPPVSVDSSDIDAQSAVPESIPDENVSLDADVESSATRMSEVGMDSETASLVQSGPIAEAREAQGELTEAAQRNPAEILVEQQEARGQAAADMAALQQQALASLQSSRSGTVGDLTSQQQGMVGTEEQMRTQIGTQAQVIFDSAQSRVNTLLDPLVPTAMRRWETGVQVLSTRFENELGRVQRWKEERHSGILGGVVEIIDNAFGYPDWIVEAYNRAERNFAEGVCRLIREISTEVNSVIAACEQIIADANTEISQLFTDLPEGLQEWAAAEQQRFTERLDGLHQQVISKRDNFNRDLAEHAAQSVQEVRQRVHELRQEAGGLLGRIAEAVNQFLEDPARFIINGLLELVGIAATAFWALIDNIQSVVNDIANDPMNFANNLMAAIGQGFQGFFDHFPEHMFEGFFEWLFSGLGSVGVEIPTDFSLQSIFTLFLQIMGITWERIRELLARYIGEENVALLERAYELIATLIEQGPEGILEMIQEQLDPRAFIDQIVQSAVDYLLEALISAVTPRIIALFNPAGAIVQAVEAIYRLLQWIFENAARIFGLVETVVNGALDIVAGRISGMATAIEDALARTLTPVIDFLAGYLGIGDLPERIADTIRGFQEMVMQVIDRIIAWLAEQGRALLQMLGVGGEEDEDVPTDHESIAQRAIEDMQEVTGSEHDYDSIRAQKERDKVEIERRYTALLEEGIALTIILQDSANDQADDDLDFFVRIAPNTTEVAGNIPTGGFLIPEHGPSLVSVSTFNVTLTPIDIQENTQTEYRNEFKRQVRGQERGINNMDVFTWMFNAERYKSNSGDEVFIEDERVIAGSEDLVTRKTIRGQNPFTGLSSSDSSLRRIVSSYYRVINSYYIGNFKDKTLSGVEFEAKKNELLNEIDARGDQNRVAEILENMWTYAVEDSTQTNVAARNRPTAALHNPDMVAGGDPLPDDVGWRSVNSSIGSQWGNEDRGKVREIHTNIRNWIIDAGLEIRSSEENQLKSEKENIIKRFNMEVTLEPK